MSYAEVYRRRTVYSSTKGKDIPVLDIYLYPPEGTNEYEVFYHPVGQPGNGGRLFGKIIPTVSGDALIADVFGSGGELEFATSYIFELIFYGGSGVLAEPKIIFVTQPENPDFDKLGVVYPVTGESTYFELLDLYGQTFEYLNIYIYKNGSASPEKYAENYLQRNSSFDYSCGTGSYLVRLSYYVVADDGSPVYAVDEFGDVYYAECVFDSAPRPAFWEWTDDEIKLFTNKGNTTNFKQKRWNDFVAHVRTMVAGRMENEGNNKIPENLYGHSDITWRAFVNYSQIPISDKTLYAKQFNILNYVINILGGETGLVDKRGYSEYRESADVLYGEYFILLSDAINRVE